MLQMNKIIRARWRVLWCVLPLPLKTDYDDVGDTVTGAVLQKEKTQETGEDRLRAMFSLNYDNMSPELHSSLQLGLYGAFVGGLFGGFIKSREAYLEFFERNQATAFKTHWEAKKLLQNHVTVNFAKGGFSLSWRLALFTGGFALVSNSISVYRGKYGIIEYSVAGGVTGSLFKTNLGVRGMLVGGLLGTALGTVGGSLIYAFLKISGMTMEDVHKTQYKSHEYRVRARLLRDKKLSEEGTKEEEILKYHDEKTKMEASLDALSHS